MKKTLAISPPTRWARSRREERRGDLPFFFAADPGGIGSAFHRAEDASKEKDHALQAEIYLHARASRVAVVISLFCPLNRKGKNFFLCELCDSAVKNCL